MASLQSPSETPATYTDLTKDLDNIVQDAARDLKRTKELEFASYHASLEIDARLTGRANAVLEFAEEL
jgi:hypothetical protein